jgi:hypothetical protein
MDEIRNKNVIKMVKLNMNFSQPRRCEPVSDNMFELPSLLPLAWRKIKADRTTERIIWMTDKVIFI